MLYCLNTSTIRNCGLSVPQKIELAARVGYQGIELWVAEIEEYLDQGGTLSGLKSLLDSNQIVCPNLIAFFQWANPDDVRRTQAIQEALQVFEIAVALDCPHVAAPPSGITDRTDISLEEIAGYYRALLDVARPAGAEPLLEFWGHSKILGSLREAMSVLEWLDDPEVRLLGDVFHMAKTAGSFDLLKEFDTSRFGLFHMNDYPEAEDIRKLTDAQRVYPGDGVAPLQEIVAALRQNGYQGMYSLELFNKEYEQAGAEVVMSTGLTKMKQVLAQ